MTTNDRRTCPIFRIEDGRFHTHIFNFDHPILNDEENVFLRVTKLSLSKSSSLLSPINRQSTRKFYKQSDKTWFDADQLFYDNITTENINRQNSVSDDYVFL